MKTYAVAEGMIPESAIADLEFVTDMLTKLPDREEVEKIGILPLSPHTQGHWSCHVLARIFAQMTKIDWQVADGFFLKRGNRHSWLWCRMGDAVLVLDVLPVAGVRPFLVDGGPYSPWFEAYVESRSYHRPEELQAWDDEVDAFLAWFTDGLVEAGVVGSR